MRLDPSLDLSQFNLTPYQLMVAKALQTYGAYDSDSSGSFKLFSAETTGGATYTSTPAGLPWSIASHLEFGTTTYAAGALNTNSNHDTGCNQQQ